MSDGGGWRHWVDPADADRKGFWIFGHLLLITIAVILVAFLVWADNAVLDIVTRGQGKVIPSSQVQVIQNLEGGIMADVLVHEGDLVEKDQVLIRIDNTTAQSNCDDLHSRYLHLPGRDLAARGGDRRHGGRRHCVSARSS